MFLVYTYAFKSLSLFTQPILSCIDTNKSKKKKTWRSKLKGNGWKMLGSWGGCNRWKERCCSKEKKKEIAAVIFGILLLSGNQFLWKWLTVSIFCFSSLFPITPPLFHYCLIVDKKNCFFCFSFFFFLLYLSYQQLKLIYS